VIVPVTDFNGNPLPDLDAKLCSLVDPQCTSPLLETVTDGGGLLHLNLPFDFSGYVEINATPYFPIVHILEPNPQPNETLAPMLLALESTIPGLGLAVGAEPNKLVAKIACTLSKPNGLSVVHPDGVRSLLDPLPIRRLWGVGPVYEQTLRSHGIQRFSDLADHEPASLVEKLGPRALELQALARGIDNRPVVSDRAPKSIGEESTFETDILEREPVGDALGAHSEAVARRLRSAGYRARTISLKAKLGQARGKRPGRTEQDGEPHYPLLTRNRSIPRATDDGLVIREIVMQLWDELALAIPVRLLGVSASNLEAPASQQLDLFGAPRKDALGPALDAINQRFGRAAIRRGASSPEKITHGRGHKPGER
jgi:DNA polymerase-4